MSDEPGAHSRSDAVPVRLTVDWLPPLAGRLENTPAGMIRWSQHPQAIVPGNVMPELGVPEQEARDMAAYLYTLR